MATLFAVVMRWFSILLPALLTGSAALAQQDWWLIRAQQEDGHWPAADFGANADADLRVNALMLLAFVGDGSCTRSGPHRDQVRMVSRWLRRNQDDAGRFLLRADPAWMLDHAMATLALAEDERIAAYRQLVAPLTAAAKALATGVGNTRPAVDVEVQLWSEVVVRSLRRSADGWAERQRLDVALALRAAADELTVALAALPVTKPKTARHRLAALLLANLRGADPAARTAPPADWPDDLFADPLLTFYAASLAFRGGGEGWRVAQKDLARLMRARIPATEKFAGSWDPVGSFGQQNGRLGTTAAVALILPIFYRCCRLSFID